MFIKAIYFPIIFFIFTNKFLIKMYNYYNNGIKINPNKVNS